MIQERPRSKPNAKSDPAIFRHASIALGNRFLDFDRAVYGVEDVAKLDDRAAIGALAARSAQKLSDRSERSEALAQANIAAKPHVGAISTSNQESPGKGGDVDE